MSLKGKRVNCKIRVSPDTMRRLGSMNLIRDIRGMGTKELRSINSCTLVSVGGECHFQEYF